ncbi:MAG TPA: isocitrate/isopropylmalate dehydrogenase family protein [Longimicrobiales bacterium]|nr:isocitrate/isopropylmalate dehydrogenase family protein [Longimicrobiales bacterium]
MSKIALIPGDGIGAEVTAEAVKALRRVAERFDLSLDLVDWDLGAERYLRDGVTITADEMAALGGEYDAILLGALGDPRVPGNEHARDILLGLRFQLDLYVNLRPIRLLDPSHSPLRDVRVEDIDMLIFRENTEGPYVGVGGAFKRGTPEEIALEEDVNTRTGVERILRAAFEHARTAGRRSVTMADKANALRYAGSLWRRCFEEVGAEYPEIERRALYVDALAMDLVLHPARYDVIVAANLLGDILSDLAAGLVGGLGLAPSANLHPGRIGLFEPVHGSAPDIAGTGRANPLASVLTAALMLDHLGAPAAAGALRSAVDACIRVGETTPDLGGTLRTAEVGERVCDHIDAEDLIDAE